MGLVPHRSTLVLYHVVETRQDQEVQAYNRELHHTFTQALQKDLDPIDDPQTPLNNCPPY